MKKVLIWGTGNVYKQSQDILKELEEAGEISILALINKNAMQVDEKRTILASEIKNLVYDEILVTAAGEALVSIKKDAEELGITADKIIAVDEFLATSEIYGRKYKECVSRQAEVLAEILTATDEQVRSYDWMKKQICRYGLYPFRTNANEQIIWTRWGILQTLDEFTRYCLFLAELKVENAIEVGVYKGRSSYFMCALLTRNNPKIKYVLVDIYDGLDSYEEYHKVLPNMVKRIPSTSDDYIGEKYDFVFIDADHSYDGSFKDYLNIGRYAGKVTVFHDIYGHEYDKLNGGVGRTWQEVKALTPNAEHKVFSTYPEEWMGIGCVLW